MKKYTFQKPDDIYRGLELWMINDRLEDDEIIHQVEEFKKKGIYSVIFRTYNGLYSDYPGPEFKRKLRVAVEAAKKCGLKIVLQAGYMPSAYPGLPKAYALHKIVPMSEEQLHGDEHVLTRDGVTAYTDQIAVSTINMLDEESMDFYIKTSYEDMWVDFADEFGKTIISVWLDEPRVDNKYLTWTPKLGEMFVKRYGYSIEENIPSLYYDIGDYKKIRYDYYTLLRDMLKNCYYMKVRTWCHSKGLTFSGHLMGEERLTMQIAQAIAVMPFYQYLDIPGIDLLRSNHDWYDKPQLAWSKYFQDFVERSMHIAAVQCVSAAEQVGKEHVLCEMYGVTSPNFVFRDQMHLFDFFAANGINHQCIHGLFYSVRGFRKRLYPQTFNVYQPFWENFRNVKDYVARVSSFISCGNCSKDVLVLHPLETAYGLFRGLADLEDESSRTAIEDYDKRYYMLIRQLYSSQIPFHFGDMSMIEQMGSVEENRFVVGKMAYSTVVVADLEVLTAKTLRLLSEFARNGGKIFIKGALPSRVDGREDETVTGILSSLPNISLLENNEVLIRALKQDNGRSYGYQCVDDASKTVINHRVDGDNNYFLIHNGDCRRAKKGELCIKGIHKAFRFDAETASISQIDSYVRNGETVIPVVNAEGGSSLIFTEPAQTSAQPLKSSKMFRVLPLDEVSCSISGENVLTLELCTYKTEKMNQFSEKEIAIERVVEKLKREKYEGEVTLRFKFYSDFCVKGLRLVLEDPEECKVTLNGKPVKLESQGYYYAKSFHVVGLPDNVCPGENIIELTRYTKPQIAAPFTDDMKHLFELFQAPVGVDLERIHILGEFLVEAIPEYAAGAGIVRYGKHFYMTEKKSIPAVADVTAHGYPFYPGCVDYTIKLNVTEDMLEAEDVILKIGIYNGCSATVLVNDKKVGCIDREPYTRSLKQALITGENKIEIRLYGTFRNMFGPSHIEGVDPSGCFRNMWWMDMEHSECTEYDSGSLTNSFQLAPLGIGDITLELI